MIIDNWNLFLLIHSGAILFFLLSILGLLGLVLVAMLFNDLNNIKLSTLIQTQVLLFKVLVLWHDIKHIFNNYITFLCDFIIQARSDCQHLEEGHWSQEFTDEVAAENANHAGYCVT